MRSPGSKLRKSAKALVDEAMQQVETVTVEQAKELLDDPAVHFVDIREPRELELQGMIPGAFRAPRGMLEFWVDPESPYYKPALDDGRTLLLYCGSAWRSALAAKALGEMGVQVAHLEGGFSAWKDAEAPIAEHSPRDGR